RAPGRAAGGGGGVPRGGDARGHGRGHAMMQERTAGETRRIQHRADTVAFHAQAAERVISAMRERLDQPFSLEEMSEVAIMSPFHFNRPFRELTGIPPCQFLSAVRLQAAKRLLLTTDLSVTDICFEVGYNSLGTFIRRFTDLVDRKSG